MPDPLSIRALPRIVSLALRLRQMRLDIILEAQNLHSDILAETEQAERSCHPAETDLKRKPTDAYVLFKPTTSGLLGR